MIYKHDEIERFKHQLQESVVVCADRCLYNATKWSAELLDGVKEGTLDLSNQYGHQHTTTGYDASLPSVNELEYNKYQYAKALFHMRQYENASYILRGMENPKLKFLRLYAKYLAGEKRKEEQTQEILGSADNSLTENPELNSIYDELRTAYDENQTMDAFCLYLYGIILRKRGDNQLAASVLLQSLKKYECNWSAWMELGTLVLNKKMFYDLQKLLDAKMTGSLIKNLFLARLALELHLPHQFYSDIMTPLTAIFPDSTYIKAQWAISFYDTMDYNESEVLFDDLRRSNPYRLEDMDVFSNLLYLKDSKEKLSVLAHQCDRIDKFRPETCCIVANYYSIKREIPLSIEYFKRALKLNRNYHWVWTLLGHDYIEMKNANAAIECYRRATDYNPRDFRAWYGLGQAYEVLKLPYYATYYYQKATDLRPHDPRMWQALGGCYEALGRHNESLDCFRRVNECDKDGRHNALIQLARIFDKMERPNAAARYYLRAIEKYETEEYDGIEVAESGLRLGRYMFSKNRLGDAERYAKIALGYSFPYHDEAQTLLDEIKNKRISTFET
ncbi:putative cell division cycle [Halteromyces radiatus]|uniref:putative cell division cycle n=1 Tax=Halteromyces radiatus TaxID=101107 RepID=UPI00221F2FD5|nr:putative cell division cycle [Halteromyces radiatus]KAI8099705.1 putative cell division cycle [Halteromyces radiatus]